MSKRLFIKHTNEHPERLKKLDAAIKAGLILAVDINANGVIYEVPDERYKNLIAVKRYRQRGGIWNR